MLLTPHTMVGIAIAYSINNPFIAVPASFFMHFMGDLVPHWDFYSNTTKEERIKGWRPLAVMADLAIGVAVGVSFTTYALWVLKDQNLALSVFLSGVASVMPDAITGPAMYIQNIKGFPALINRIQSKLQMQAPLPWGVISQIIVSVFSFLLIVNSIKQ